MPTSQEMNLTEYVSQLPRSHAARKQYNVLLAQMPKDWTPEQAQMAYEDAPIADMNQPPADHPEIRADATDSERMLWENYKHLRAKHDRLVIENAHILDGDKPNPIHPDWIWTTRLELRSMNDRITDLLADNTRLRKVLKHACKCFTTKGTTFNIHGEIFVVVEEMNAALLLETEGLDKHDHNRDSPSQDVRNPS